MASPEAGGETVRLAWPTRLYGVCGASDELDGKDGDIFSAARNACVNACALLVLPDRDGVDVSGVRL